MAIEFNCPECQGRLRTPDGTSGKKARCPNCSEVVLIPDPGVGGAAHTPEDPPPAGPPPVGGTAETTPSPTAEDFGFEPPPTNPYAAPEFDASAGREPASMQLGDEIATGPVTAADIVRSTWKAFGKNPGIPIVAFIIVFVANIPFSWISAAANAVHPTASFAAQTLGQLVQLYLGIGLARISLSIARGRAPSLDLLLPPFPIFFNLLLLMLGLGLVFGGSIGAVIGVGALLGNGVKDLAVIPGAILVIVGAYVLLMFWPVYYLIIDRGMGIQAALALASQLTSGRALTSVAIWLIGIAIMLIGFLACCLGMFVAAPFSGVLWAMYYLRLSGEPTIRA